jgi:hypothetical protein
VAFVGIPMRMIALIKIRQISIGPKNADQNNLACGEEFLRFTAV